MTLLPLSSPPPLTNSTRDEQTNTAGMQGPAENQYLPIRSIMSSLHETVYRFDDPPVSPPGLLSCPRPEHRFLSEQQAKGEFSAEISVASKTLRSSARHWASIFSGPPGLGLFPPAIVQNTTRQVSRCLAVCKRRHHLQMAVSVLSGCVRLRALAYNMRGSACVAGVGSQ